MTPQESLHARFEAWALTNGLSESVLAKTPSGFYRWEATETAWSAYQAGAAVQAERVAGLEAQIAEGNSPAVEKAINRFWAKGARPGFDRRQADCGAEVREILRDAGNVITTRLVARIDAILKEKP